MLYVGEMHAGIRRRIAAIAATAPRTYWLVWWGTLINKVGGFVIPMLTIYLMSVQHASATEAGVILSVYGAGALLASLTGGYLADHWGRKRTLVLSLYGGALALTGLGFAREMPTITAMVGVVGFVGELFRPAVFAIVADVVPPAQRVKAYALLHWVINIGFSIAMIVGGLLAKLDFALLFALDAATMLIYGTIVLVTLPETRPSRRLATGMGEIARRSRPWFTDQPFVVFVGISFGVALLAVQNGAPLQAHMAWQGFSPAQLGVVLAVNGVVVTLLQPTISAWCVQRDPTRVLIVAALLFGGGMALHGLATHLIVHMSAALLWTIGEILESPTRSSIVATMAPADARGRYQGAVVMGYGAAQLVGPMAGTWLWTYAGHGALWFACFGFGVLLVGVLIASGPARRRRMARVT